MRTSERTLEAHGSETKLNLTPMGTFVAIFFFPRNRFLERESVENVGVFRSHTFDRLGSLSLSLLPSLWCVKEMKMAMHAGSFA